VDLLTLTNSMEVAHSPYNIIFKNIIYIVYRYNITYTYTILYTIMSNINVVWSLISNEQVAVHRYTIYTYYRCSVLKINIYCRWGLVQGTCTHIIWVGYTLRLKLHSWIHNIKNQQIYKSVIIYCYRYGIYII